MQIQTAMQFNFSATVKRKW